MSASDTSPLAIACSLTAEEMPARLREVAAIGEAGLLDARVGDSHAILQFAPRAGVRERLDAIVAAESRCCGFMTFDLRDDGAQLALRIDVPRDAQPVLEEFVASFTPERAVA